MTKKERQLKIIQLIQDSVVRTQEELLLLLRQHGYQATQATLSRDMKELHLQKVTDPKEGGLRYAMPSAQQQEEGRNLQRYKSVLHQVILSAVSAENIAVLRTLSGTANAAGAALETVSVEGLIGNLAGDDTLLCIFTDADAASDFCRMVNQDYIKTP